uniref:Uncharacterized protein n=1 Tax=Arundo donax TaxID=35708 RepID=A0A0A9AIM2_ARUDO
MLFSYYLCLLQNVEFTMARWDIPFGFYFFYFDVLS